VAKNIGTMPGNTRTGHTALMDSATAIDQSAFFGGQALDISFAPDALTSERDRLAIQALLQTYFRLGGLQVQVNSIDSATLRRAIDDPESHRHLIVRIAGYSARFVTLGTSVQHEMADRFERGV
jgi:formate C-acetyltransferase